MLARRLNLGYTVPNDLPRKGNERMVIPMKKMLAMLLAVLTLCFGAAAMAESVPEVDDAAEQAALTDLTANGQLIEGDGFQFYIPADWEAAELTDEETEAGYVFAAASADEANQLIITYQALDAAKTAEEVQPGLAEVYPTATVMDLNGTSVVAFHDADEDVLGIVVMDTVDPGYYIFMFTPASDADFLPVADAIAASYTAVQ